MSYSILLRRKFNYLQAFLAQMQCYFWLANLAQNSIFLYWAQGCQCNLSVSLSLSFLDENALIITNHAIWYKILSFDIGYINIATNDFFLPSQKLMQLFASFLAQHLLVAFRQYNHLQAFMAQNPLVGRALQMSGPYLFL